MIKILEKQLRIFNKKYCTENNVLLFKSKVLKPLNIGNRTIEFLDEKNCLVGKITETKQNDIFKRIFFIEKKEVAVLKGYSYKNDDLYLSGIPWGIIGSVKNLQYTVKSGDELIFSYENSWIKGGKITISNEKHLLLSLMISFAISMDCDADYSSYA